MSEHIEWQQLHELLKELAQKEYGDKYGEQIFWYFQDVVDDSCKLDVLEEENDRLNNIINELEKYLIEYSQDLEFRCYANTFLDKLRELKGDSSNGSI